MILRTILLTAVFVATAIPVDANEFYVDSNSSHADGDGSEQRPWKSLQEVFENGSVESQAWDSLPRKDTSKLVPKNPAAMIKPGDTIWLRSGDYGDLQIQGHYNTGTISLAAAAGHTPRFHSIRLRSGSHWKLKGLHVSAEFPGDDKPRTLIDIESHGWHGPISDVVVEDCVLQSAADTSHWTAAQWNELACNGINADGTRITIRDNKLLNVNFGINVEASHALVENNTVTNFSGDGMRGLGDHSVFQYNTIKNCYDVNDNHDDGFQSWSRTADGVGTGEVVGIVLRGNTIINYEEPNQPHRGPLQGIGCFDGMYVDWVIENNVVIVDHYHGITLLGARGCRIINNTVFDPHDVRPGPAALRISNHKKGTPASDCTIRNNLVSALAIKDVPSMTLDHNIVIDSPQAMFVDAAKYDLRLRKDSPAVDAGSSELAPKIDRAGTPRPQGTGIDVGAFELMTD